MLMQLLRRPKKTAPKPVYEDVPFVDTRVSRTFPTPFGEAKVITAIGYYRNAGIILHLPEGHGFPEKIADTFLELTDGQFHMDRVYPGAGTDGLDWGGVALISAGKDYRAYTSGKAKGYFKDSPAPDIDVVAIQLEQLFNSNESELFV